jgi:2-oxoglutarate ferredoxin oxidoreductase subunit delta
LAETKAKGKKKYRIEINHTFCTGCGNCIEYCPQHVLEKDTKLNKRGIYAPVVADADKCTGCDLCMMYCGNFSIGVGPVSNEEEVER